MAQYGQGGYGQGVYGGGSISTSNFSRIVTDVQALAGNHSSATTIVVGGFVNSCHEELLAAHEWSRKKSEIILAGAPDKTAGTVTLTNSLATILGSGTAFHLADVGKYVLINDSLYVFSGFVDPTSGILADYNGSALVYPGDTASSLNYVLFKRWYSLGIGIGSILTVSHQAPIFERDQEFLDAIDPARQSAGSNPLYFARGPRNSSDFVQIEFWPRLSTGIVVNVLVLKAHVDMTGTEHPIVPASAVKWPAAAKTCYHLFAKNKEPKWLTLAGEYNKQATTALEEAKNQDAKQFGRSHTVKDVGGHVGLADTDWALQHDVL